MEVREVLSREGREAKNLLVYQFCDENAANSQSGSAIHSDVSQKYIASYRKPPVAPSRSIICFGASSQSPKKCHSPTNCVRHLSNTTQTSGPRVRSASTGRDKKSELQARYWALLFGNLQRAVNEIYQTVESYENISSCQEAILVLENYVRDFKALGEWFKVSWDYESRPIQQRPQSLAWEVRKSNPFPRVRAKSLSSPTHSGRSSPGLIPCNMGTTSPSEGHAFVKKNLRHIDHFSKGAIRVEVRDLLLTNGRPTVDHLEEQQNQHTLFVEVDGIAHKYSQTDLEDDHLTLADLRNKLAEMKDNEERLKQQDLSNVAHIQEASAAIQKPQHTSTDQSLSLDLPVVPEAKSCVGEVRSIANVEETIILPNPRTALEITVQQMESIENSLLKEEGNKKAASATLGPGCANDNVKKLQSTAASVVNSSQSSPLKYSSVLNRPVSSRTTIPKPSPTMNTVNQVAKLAVLNNKPKTVTKANVNRTAGVAVNVGNRSSTIRYTRNFTTNQTTQMPYKKECHKPSSTIASRLPARSKTTMDLNVNNANSKPLESRNQPTSESNVRLGTLCNVAKKTQSSVDDMSSSSSTLKASNEHIEVQQSNSIESKHIAQDSNEGWLTVKTKRRSSMHWTSRFYQPTGYASLPTLALLNEKQEKKRDSEKTHSKKSSLVSTSISVKTENLAKPIKAQKLTKQVLTRPEIKNAKAKINSLPGQTKLTLNKKAEKMTTPSSSRSSNTIVSKTLSGQQTTIKRQKSDITGLKMTSLHKEYMRNDRISLLSQQNAVNENRNCTVGSSVETVIEASINTQTLDADSAGGENNKIDIKIQTNREFSKTIGELYECIARTSKVDKILNGCVRNSIPTLSSCDEIDENGLTINDDCDEENNEQLLIEEQELLERQIRELESTEIDVDTETDETDCEVVIEDNEEVGDQSISSASRVVFLTMSDDENISLELRYQSLLSEMSWNERAETLATLQAFVTRHPGRAQELHQKLSSPSRRRSLQETLKKYQAKQARAQEKRELLQKEKAIKIQQLLTRVEAVKVAKKQLIEDKRVKMEGRLQRAAENRELFLRQIIEKAHDEEKKLKEINFIKSIEAQNKRLDLIESCKETEVRLQDLEQERQKRLEEKAAKEAAVERRRQELEKERQRKLEKMNESRLEKEQRIGKMQEQKERQRQELAREKARDREERLLALQVQQQQTTEELQRKIKQKQLESARRHEENMEHIRQRALELTIPTRNVDEIQNKNCETDDGLEVQTPVFSEDCSSTASDIGGREHSCSYKKKMKKLKQRMTQSAAEYFRDMEPLSAHVKRESQVPKLLHLIIKGGGVQGLERDLGNLLRLLAKAKVCDFQTFLHMDGLGIVANNVILKSFVDKKGISNKSITLSVQLYRNACSLCPQIARHALLGNSIIILFDAIIKTMQLSEKKSPHQPVELSTELMLACTEALSSKYVKKTAHPKVPERLPDMINYAVITGLIEILARRCMKVRESVENDQSTMLSLLTTLGFLSRFIDVCPIAPADPTRLLHSARSTDLFGTVSMIYACVVPIGDSIPKRTISLAASTFNLFVSLAALDINTFQGIVSNEAIAIKLLDVISLLLTYCGNKTAMVKNTETQTMMIDLIGTVSLYCINRRKHQDFLASDQYSSIIRSLTKLPEYYNPFVYPCLVVITFKNQKNRNMVAKDFNMELLEEYRNSETAKKNHLISLLRDNA